jgi:uncharacterized protein (TIGR02452 family)
MSRTERAAIAQQTVEILTQGYYNYRGQQISIREELATCCDNTLLYRPDDYNELHNQLDRLAHNTVSFGVSNRTTFAAAQQLNQHHDHVAALNFASAKNPGGGFLSGSQAQEESLARASGLYASLNTKPKFYAFHRQQANLLYSDHTIYSPFVPVFRDDRDQLLTQPWLCSIITSAAVNKGALLSNEPQRRSEIDSTMLQRCRMVCAIAANEGVDALVLGAWGCGVFRNDPNDVAGYFRTVLLDEGFAQYFKHIEFAILDRSAQQETFKAFEETFAQ